MSLSSGCSLSSATLFLSSAGFSLSSLHLAIIISHTSLSPLLSLPSLFSLLPLLFSLISSLCALSADEDEDAGYNAEYISYGPAGNVNINCTGNPYLVSYHDSAQWCIVDSDYVEEACRWQPGCVGYGVTTNWSWNYKYDFGAALAFSNKLGKNAEWTTYLKRGAKPEYV